MLLIRSASFNIARCLDMDAPVIENVHISLLLKAVRPLTNLIETHPVRSLNSFNPLNNSSILFQNNPGKHWNHSTNQKTDSHCK